MLAPPPAPRTWPFFVAAYAITWLLDLPAVAARVGLIAGPFERFLPFVGLGALGPLLAAVLVARFGADGGGVRALFRPMLTFRVGLRWWVLALGLPAAAYLLGRAVYHVAGGDPAVPWQWPPQNAERLAALVMFPLGEEVGWRGFALPRLQLRLGRLPAALVVGVGWAFWHVPMFVIAGAPPEAFAISFVYLLAGSVTMSWIYNHTGQSLLLAVMAHAGAHLCNPNQAPPGDVVPLLLATFGLGVAAVVVVAADRAAWRAPQAPASATST